MPIDSTESRRRRPKGDKRARTRAKILAAAREVIRERGYARTTLKDVAERAGVTSGSIYGNFKNRDDLFVSLAAVYWAPIKPQFASGSTFADKMRSLADATIAAIPERRMAVAGRLTGMAYALTNEDLIARVREVTAKSYGEGAAWLRAVVASDDLPMSPEHLVRVIHALTEGLVLQRLLTPDLVPDEVFYAAFAALAVGRERERERER